MRDMLLANGELANGYVEACTEGHHLFNGGHWPGYFHKALGNPSRISKWGNRGLSGELSAPLYVVQVASHRECSLFQKIKDCCWPFCIICFECGLIALNLSSKLCVDVLSYYLFPFLLWMFLLNHCDKACVRDYMHCGGVPLLFSASFGNKVYCIIFCTFIMRILHVIFKS